jgi:hypothetical protein
MRSPRGRGLEDVPYPVGRGHQHHDDLDLGNQISVLIDEKYMELAVRALHKAFELEKA